MTMAGILQLQPLEQFSFLHPEQWPRWKQRFDQFRLASGLIAESEERQISMLLYSMGPDAQDVLETTSITAEEKARFDSVVSKFDEYFGVRKNVIFERAQFNLRKQQAGETGEQYILALYAHAAKCGYTDQTQKERDIRDRLVVGIRDTQLSRRMQLDPLLTLDNAKKHVLQTEAVQETHKKLAAGDSRDNPVEVDSVTWKKDKRGTPRGGDRHVQRHRQRSQFRKNDRDQKSSPSVCTRCGKEPHSRRVCPARDAECHKCGKRGHFSAQCRSKNVISNVSLEPGAGQGKDVPVDTGFLDSLTAAETSGPAVWNVTVFVDKQAVTFKVDTGAEVTAISDFSYRQLKGIHLNTASRVLCGPDHSRLKVLGQFKSTLGVKERTIQQDIFVVKGLKSNLLGLPAIQALQLAARLDSVEQSYRDQIISEYPGIFHGLGTLGEPYKIDIDPDAKPYAIFTPRRVPYPLQDKVKQELSKMETLGVISKVEDSTEWCAGMVAVPKKSGGIRICVDLKPLNESVKRQPHPLPTVESILSQLSGAKIFSKLDANSGFWQIPLSPESRPLTTFLTPFGRYHFNKLPFGLSSAPELFQKRMGKLLEGLDGVVCLIDDVLIFAADKEEHDLRLRAVLNRMAEAGTTLNMEKCVFQQTELKFLGHVLNQDGVSPDPEKTRAIALMPAPEGVPALRRFLGMVNHLGKFSHRLSELTKPLRDLLSAKNSWSWGPDQDRAFQEVKEELSRPTVLALYSPQVETKVSADSSSFGLGAVLLQRQTSDSAWKPVAYASRALTETEGRYAQVEKEALACTWAAEKFSDYLLGKHFTMETDHKPLVSLLGNKNLDNLPPRVLRFRLRLSRFLYSVEHVPGKSIYTADTLSRSLAPSTDSDGAVSSRDVNCFIDAIITSLPASTDRLQTYKAAQEEDQICKQIITYCKQGWPEKQVRSKQFNSYWGARHKFTIVDGLLLYGSCIVIPSSLQAETLDKIHTGHLGVQKCLSRAKTSVWWPGMTGQLKRKIQECRECREHLVQRKEPLIPSKLPAYPWEEVGADLFHLRGVTYLLVVDYCSKFPELIKLTSTTASNVINALKAVFARHGIPSCLRSDNGPQFDCSEMEAFATSYGFKHRTSSPRFPQSNGQVERAVQTIKNLLRKSDDLFLSLLVYRSTPLRWCGRSPAELCMGRKLSTNLPQLQSALIPEWTYLDQYREADKIYKDRVKQDYDRRHGTNVLPELPNHSAVLVDDPTGHNREPGITIDTADAPRSYVVKTSSGGIIRRNRHQLITNPSSSPPKKTVRFADPPADCIEPPANHDTPPIFKRSPIVTRSRTRALQTKGDVES